MRHLSKHVTVRQRWIAARGANGVCTADGGGARENLKPVPGSKENRADDLDILSILFATVEVRGLFGGRARGEGAGSTSVASVDLCMHMNGSANNEY